MMNIVSKSADKKMKTLFFLQLSYTFSMTKHNHTTKYNHKTYRKHRGQWSLRSAFHFLPIGVEARISTPLSACRIMGFQAEEFWCREEKQEGKWKGGMGFHFSSYVLSYVFKSVVELELFSNLRYFKYHFP